MAAACKTDGRVHAIDPKSGHELAGWPVHTDATVVVKKHAGIKPGFEPIVSNISNLVLSPLPSSQI